MKVYNKDNGNINSVFSFCNQWTESNNPLECMHPTLGNSSFDGMVETNVCETACVGKLGFPSPKSLMWLLREHVWKCPYHAGRMKASVFLQSSTLRYVTAPAGGYFHSPHCTIRKKFEWHMMIINDVPKVLHFIITTRIYSICM